MKNIVLIKVFLCLLCFSAFSCGKKQNIESVAKAVPKKDSTLKVDYIPNSDANSDNILIENIKKVITTKYLKLEDLKVIDSTERKFSLEQADINNDGKKEIFISFSTTYFCGTGGCSLILLDSELNIINTFTVTQTPVYINPDFKNGWNVLFVKSKDEWKELVFDKGKYPSNPSVVKNSNNQPDPKAVVIFKDSSSLKKYNF